jgi:hypothetical protein
MLTISSIAVSPWPQPAPAAKVQPLTAAKASNTVSTEDSGVALPVAGADGNGVQTAYLPSALPPVDPAKEAVVADMPNNPAAPEKPTEAVPPPEANPSPSLDRRFRGQLPPQPQTPVEVAMERQINELLPNLWQASRAAVDVLIGEEAKAAAAKAAELSVQATTTPEAVEGLQSYASPVVDKPAPGSVVNTQA